MRVFYKDSLEIAEITNLVKRVDSESFPMSYVKGDYIYLLSDLPFNHFYLSIGDVVNYVSANMKVEYYTLNKWIEVVNINDLTNGLEKSGHVDFTPDRQESWYLGSTKDVNDSILDLETIRVYDVYAVRISFDADLAEGVNLNYLGHNFSDDIDLYSEFPIFNDMDFLTSFKSGKTSWEEQSIKAADIIIKDLKAKNVIMGAGQILDRSLFTNASIHKTAELIFSSFGNDYQTQKSEARKEYTARMNMKIFNVDKDNNAIPSAVENTYSQGWLSR